MGFFNTKHVVVKSSNMVKSVSPTLLTFYVAEIYNNIGFTSVEILPYVQDGRNQTNLAAFSPMTYHGNNVYSYTLNGSLVTPGVNLYFRIKATDVHGQEHLLSTEKFDVVSAT